MNPLQEISALVDSPQALTWVFTGDSITHGLAHTDGGRSLSEHVHEAWRGEIGRGRDVVINTAISGHRLGQVLDDWDRRVAQWQPQVVPLMIGTNDCAEGEGRERLTATQFADDLRQFVERTRAAGAIPLLQTPPPVDVAHAPERSRFVDFVEQTRAVAAEGEVALVDHHLLFTNLAKEQPTPIPWRLMSDAIHPNAAGHALLAWHLLTSLGWAERCPRTIGLLAARASIALPWGAPPLP